MIRVPLDYLLPHVTVKAIDLSAYMPRYTGFAKSLIMAPLENEG